jgi:hypothetical protein
VLGPTPPQLHRGSQTHRFPHQRGTPPQRRHYCILRASAAHAFHFVPAAQRLQAIHDAIATVDTWLFKPFSDAPADHWLGCLRISQRQSLTILETAAALRCAASHVRDLHKLNQLTATNISTTPDAGPQTLRIQRPSLVTFVQVRLARENNLSRDCGDIQIPG